MKSLNLFFVLALGAAMMASGARADLVIDVSGSDGQNAPHGRAGSGYAGNGSDAGRSTSGQDSGKIDVTLSELGDGRVRISGSHDRTFSTSDPGRIVLRANGGKGGDGGHGGNGSRGRDGSSGRDATRYSSGTNGESGGPGGDGGNGSSGSNGGSAGTIVVKVKEKDMHLLYLLASPEVRGGAGGARGRNGSGGSGGSGGRGGSSYSWQEPYTSTCTESYTGTCTGTRSSRSGNGSSVSVSYTYSCSKTRTVSCTKYQSKSNSGGMSGSSGRSGSDGRALLSEGSSGHDGSYKFIVEYKDGRIESYSRVFDLAITGFQVESDFKDEFVQPGEKMKLTGIAVTNRGGMPSPTMTPIRLRADSKEGGFLSPDSQSVDIKNSIPAGGTFVVRDPILTEVLRRAIGEPNAETAKHRGGIKKAFTVGISAEIVGIKRLFERFTTARTLVAKHPVAISRVLGKRAIGVNDDYLFRWSIENSSKHAIGAATDSQRQVRIVSSFAFNDGKNSDAFFLKVRKGDNESAVSSQSIDSVDSRRGAGASESTLLWAKLGFNEKARVLDEGTMKIVVEIEDPYIKGKWAVADVAYFPVKVGTPFLKTENASVLLVTSPQTTEVEIAAWREMLMASNRLFDIWDVGIMGPFDFGTKGLSTHYAGGTIIVLNDLIKQPGDEAVPVDAMFKLGPSDLIETAKKNRIGVFVYDRTGSYKALAGGYDAMGDRTSEDPMFVAVKVSKESFKSPDYIKSQENLVSVAMTLSFDRKLEEISKAFRSGSIDLASIYAAAIMSDLGVEQINAIADTSPSGEAFDRTRLRLLVRLVEHGLIDPVNGGDDSVYQDGSAGQVALEISARLWFLSHSQERTFFWQDGNVVSRHTTSLIERFLKKSFKADDRWRASRAENESYKRTMEWISKRSEDLENQAKAMAKNFVAHDKSRFFTFPRAWNGDYYRQAAYSLIMRPVFNRTYTHKMEIFDEVLKKERLVVPAFN